MRISNRLHIYIFLLLLFAGPAVSVATAADIETGARISELDQKVKKLKAELRDFKAQFE